MNRLALVAALAGCAMLAACSLAEDITPPPGAPVSAPPTATQAAEPAFPVTAPSIAAGAVIYQENCVRCHGPEGRGDGELAAQLQYPPSNFTDPALVSGATPRDWYDIITNGNLERLMPPWAEALTATQRWHLVAYLFSLSAPPETLEAGRQVYAETCAACHGPSGVADGLPGFADQQYMAARSNADLLASLDGAGHRALEALAAPEAQSVIAYIRAFSFSTDLPELGHGAVTGTLTNGTTGQALPEGQPVELRLFDNFEPAGSLTTTLQPGGVFLFTDVALAPGRALIVTSEHDNVLYSSDVAQVSPEQTSYDLPMTVYDATTDPAAVSVDRMHVVFELNQGAVQVGQLYVLSNTGNKTVRAEAEGGPSVPFGLPAGAGSLTFQDGNLGERYILTDPGFADTFPLGPGIGVRQILVSYKLAYNGSLAFAQPITLPTGDINILLPEAQLIASGPNLVDAGLQTVSGAQFRSYTVQGLQPGDVLAFELRGGSLSFDWRGLLVGGLSLALATVVAVYWWVEAKRARTPEPAAAATASRARLSARREELLAALAELDDRFERGEQPAAEYGPQRARLKDELRRVLEQQAAR